MIIGRSFNELKNYLGISKNLDFAIHYLLENTIYECGKTELLGKNVVLTVEEYEPRAIEDCYFENHQNYLDIQVVLSGKEGFGYANVSNSTLVITAPYNPDKDVTKYSVEGELIYEMVDHSFAIVFPEDLHMPKIKLPDSQKVKKAVFKVKL